MNSTECRSEPVGMLEVFTPPYYPETTASQHGCDGSIRVRGSEWKLRRVMAWASALYAALASPAPASLADVQAQLGADEALLLFFDRPQLRTRQSTPFPEETFIWVVTKSDVCWVRAPISARRRGGHPFAVSCAIARASPARFASIFGPQ